MNSTPTREVLQQARDAFVDAAICFDEILRSAQAGMTSDVERDAAHYAKSMRDEAARLDAHLSEPDALQADVSKAIQCLEASKIQSRVDLVFKAVDEALAYLRYGDALQAAAQPAEERARCGACWARRADVGCEDCPDGQVQAPSVGDAALKAIGAQLVSEQAATDAIGRPVVRKQWYVATPPAGERSTPAEPRNSAGETPTEHAHRWATELAVSMARKFYPEVPQFKPLPDLLGVITQIDNMTCGLVRATPAEPQPVQWPADIRPPFTVRSGRTLIHIETDMENPVEAGVAVCSLPLRHEALADAIVDACNRATPPSPQPKGGEQS